MLYVGIDAGKTYKCCILESEKKEPSEVFAFNYGTDGFDLFLNQISSYNQPPENIKVGISETSLYSLSIARCVANHGIAPYIFLSTTMERYKKSHTCQNMIPNRNDFLAACMLQSDLKVKPVTTAELDNPSRLNLRLFTEDDYLMYVESRNRFQETFNDFVEQLFPELPQYLNLDSDAARTLLKEFPGSQKIASASLQQLRTTLDKVLKNSVNIDLAEQIHEAAKKSKAPGIEDGEFTIKMLIDQIESDDHQIQELKNVLKEKYHYSF
jgi:hypothetical protein